MTVESHLSARNISDNSDKWGLVLLEVKEVTTSNQPPAEISTENVDR